MALDQLIKVELDELRMQMLGTEVLFGFQFTAAFQQDFHDPHRLNLTAAVLLILAIGIALAVPAQHRLVERGNDTVRLYRLAVRMGTIGLLPLAATLGLDTAMVAGRMFGWGLATVLGGIVTLACGSIWFGHRVLVPASAEREKVMNELRDSKPDLHSRIDHMLTEARVILPGAQALLGFQFIAMLTKPFAELDRPVQLVHFAGLGCVLLGIILLIAPAAIHRLSFRGADSDRFHRIGSAIVTAALVPLAAGIACDLHVVIVRTADSVVAGVTGAVLSFAFLAAAWYAVPLWIRHRPPEAPQ